MPAPDCFASRARRFDGIFQRAGHVVRHGATERACKIGRRLADEIGLAHARKKRAQRLKSARFGAPASDPENIIK